MVDNGDPPGIKMSILSFLLKNAENFPDSFAIIERNYLAGGAQPYRATLTHRQLLTLSVSIGHALNGLSQRHTHIALLMDNCLELLPTFWGILASGAVAVMLNTRCSVQELVSQMQRTNVTCLIYGTQNAKLAMQLAQHLQGLRCAYVVPGSMKCHADFFGCDLLDLANASVSLPHSTLDFPDDAPAVIYFSSGSTGEKKAVLLDHGSLSFSSRVERECHGQTPQDTFLCIPPFYHAGALVHSLGGLSVGANTVLLRGIQTKMILDTIACEKCTVVWMPVPCAIDILDQVTCGTLDLREYDLSSLRLVHMGAQPISDTLVDRWKMLFHDVAYETTYGLTEAGGPNVLHSGTDGNSPPGVTGKPGPGWDCQIVDHQGCPLPDNLPGELVIRGRGVMQGYYGDPDSTAAVLSPEGWLHTEDIAYRDSYGFYHILDRRKNVIIRGGENLYPAEIEAALQQLPGIAEVVVVGIPDHRLGEVPVCAVRLNDGFRCSESAILNMFHIFPKAIRPIRCFLCDIPHLSTGKPNRVLLSKSIHRISGSIYG